MIIIIIAIVITALIVAWRIMLCFEFEPIYKYVLDEKHGCYSVAGGDIENFEKLGLKEFQIYRCKKVLASKKIRRANWDSSINAIFFFLAIPMVPFGICIGVHSSITINFRTNNYIVKIDDLRDRESTLLMTLKGSYNIDTNATTYHILIDKPLTTMAEINQYNSDVKEFKSELYKQKVCRDNPWINWLTCPAVERLENYNPDATSYRDILGTELKTFELK